MWPFSTSSYLTVVNSKRAERTRALESAAASSHRQEDFTNATATEIVFHIEKGEWTASEVIEAYIARAAFAHDTTNCLTEVMFDWAREQAKDLDYEFASTKKLRGPLHGVPTSFKEQFDIIGFDTSIGFSQWANRPALAHADLVAQFLAAGAVLFVKTNVPQTMFAFECSNPVWGRTTNPYNAKYTSGGSSGGEAALLAMDGSAVGIGSDIGGSLRIPTAYCGIYSLKPAAGRISPHGAKGPVPGFEGIKTVVGPMGRSIDDLELVSRLVFGVQGLDQNIAPLPFRDVELPAKLRFGYYTSDNYAKASPANKRAVLETVAALKKQGHECIEFDVPGAAQAFNIFVGLTSADGYKKMLSHIGPDPTEKSLFLVSIGPRMFSFIRNFAAWTLETFFSDRIFASTVRNAKVRSIGEYTDLVAAREDFIKTFHRHVWDKHSLDGIIAPVQALPQLPHGGCDNFSALAAGTILYNVLDSAVGCLPVTRVDPAKDQLTEEWKTGPGLGSPLMEAGLYRGKKPLYNPEEMAGMPVAIQIAGKKWEEEKVLAMMRVIDEALGKDRGFGPGKWDRHTKAKAL
ncbi:putative amidase PB8B6.03 [Hypsizygus marmoreus]|uniref:amidase n=1 Tax=Hypsizygus marmoreus TaxID=39966 RepID=A0A369JK38_HYPMA|nr:putative amidase PB8B6.03 [Hypsizygus marmoreus]